MTEAAQRLARRLDKEGLDAALVTSPLNIRYLTGSCDSGGVLLVTRKGQTELIAQQSKPDVIAGFVRELRIASLGYEDGHLTVRQLKLYESALACEMVPMDDVMEELRRAKSPEEIACIRTSLEIAQQSLDDTIKDMRIGMTERRLAARLAYHLLKNGSESGEFGIICVSGENSAFPHGKASDKPLKHGEFLLIDFGAIYKGYYSDITRTVAIGDASRRMRDVYETVRRACEEAASAVVPGKTGREIDAVARRVIEEAGYGPYFTHGLGHAVGLDIHENPRLSPTVETPLAPDYVVTVEPGIYLPGEFGVRIEDLILVTDGGCENLTSMTRELQILG